MKSLEKNILIYIIKNYPKDKHKTRIRMSNLVYLIDLEYFKRHKKQLTKAKWLFKLYFPYSKKIDKILNNKKLFHKKEYKNNFKAKIKKIVLNDDINYKLDKNIIDLIDKIIKKVKNMTFNQYFYHIISTKPMQKVKQKDEILFNQKEKNVINLNERQQEIYDLIMNDKFCYINCKDGKTMFAIRNAEYLSKEYNNHILLTNDELKELKDLKKYLEDEFKEEV